MDYNLDSLGSRNFEHLVQALTVKAVGQRVTVFGDGPDGGREATWRGEAPSLRSLENWNGYGVVQAKHKLQTDLPERNLAWVKTQIRLELNDWAKSESNRTEKPDFILFATNARLSSVPNGGKDQIEDYIAAQILEKQLPIKDYRVWDYYDLIVRLDDAEDIRRRYSAFITPGDLIAALINRHDDFGASFGSAIAAYTARSFRDENLLNLTQAGTAGDAQATIADVFVDLPANLPSQSWVIGNSDPDDLENEPDEYIDFLEDLDEGALFRAGVSNHLINDFNHIPESRGDGHPDTHRTVLIGGPGQGKSTVTQWLAQIYRAAFLHETPVSRVLDVATVSAKIEGRRTHLGLPAVTARRWPVRIVLTELADFLAKQPNQSLIHYIADMVSDRASMAVDPSMLRKWLASYPWLVLIDGLDEVPASSNRQQVMTAIQNFFLDVATLEADVAAVATTRPQGYTEEFSPREYRHFELNSLMVEEALSYAEGLVAIRVGTGTQANKVLERLKRASTEEHTRKLFESPLQVTILEVLLEKIGKAPNDRSRLYSEYYRIISQREQEKSGALSDLLQRYEADVHYLHRQVGYVLQQRGAVVGEATSSLSITEFEDFIKTRFEDQGHEGEGIEKLSEEFATLVTDRLVFLAKVQADRIGFELRSLQEFMAAEYIVNLAEQTIVPAIHEIAVDPYWRNVVLFATGSIFAHREHLRAEAVILCDRLNDEPPSAAVIKPGSDLAIDILKDGSCLSMPVYARRLAKTALQMLQSPHGLHVETLLVLKHPDLVQLLWNEIEQTSPAGTAVVINRAHLLSRMTEVDRDRARQSLSRLFGSLGDSVKRHYIEWAWSHWDREMGRAVDTDFTLCSPEVFFKVRSNARPLSSSKRDPQATPQWMANLARLSERLSEKSWEREDGGFDSVRAFYRPLGEDVDTWSWVRDLSVSDENWLPLQSIADFALQPTEATLAASVVAMGNLVHSLTPTIAPWPYVACIRFAESKAQDVEGAERRKLFHELGDAIRSGQLGTNEDWTAAQERWGPQILVNRNFFELDEPSGEWPISPEIRTVGIVPSAYMYSARRGLDSDDWFDELELVEALVQKSTLTFDLVDLAVFLLRVSDMPDSDRASDRIGRLYDTIGDFVLEDGRVMSMSWLSTSPNRNSEPSTDHLVVMGLKRHLTGSVDVETVARFVELAQTSEHALPFLRLALVADPQSIDAFSSELIVTAVADEDTALLGGVLVAKRLLAAEPEALWQGEVDELFVRIAGMSNLPLGVDWFMRLLADREPGTTRELAARGAWVVADRFPAVAETWLSFARRGSRIGMGSS